MSGCFGGKVSCVPSHVHLEHAGEDPTGGNNQRFRAGHCSSHDQVHVLGKVKQIAIYLNLIFSHD